MWKRLIDSALDPVTWFWVFFVGLIVTVLSSYLRDFIDKAFGRVSARARARREREVKKLVVKALELASDPNQMLMEGIESLRSLVFMLASAAVSLLGLTLASALPFLPHPPTRNVRVMVYALVGASVVWSWVMSYRAGAHVKVVRLARETYADLEDIKLKAIRSARAKTEEQPPS